jgi:PAS domain S-box-containing protein
MIVADSSQFSQGKFPDAIFDSICPHGFSFLAGGHREDWLRLAAEESQMGLWHWDEVRRQLFWDRKTREMFGADANEEVTLETFYGALHPADLDRVKQYRRHALKHGLQCDLEYRSLRPDGKICWIRSRGKGYYDEAGKPLCMVGVVFDVTKRKEAERELIELSGRLIKAQEEERAHLAREIHDEFLNRLALVANELQFAHSAIWKSPREASERLDRAQTDVREISADLHGVSHRLHSAVLEYLGLIPAVRSYCNEIARQYQIQIEFHQNVPNNLPPEAALCLFRIVQEGLRNVTKHSRASRVDVVLEGGAQTVSLTLCDNGIGFELSDNFVSGGIGIISMRERARMLGGTFEVLSRPGQGTQIDVTVPIGSSETFAR